MRLFYVGVAGLALAACSGHEALVVIVDDDSVTQVPPDVDEGR